MLEDALSRGPISIKELKVLFHVLSLPVLPDPDKPFTASLAQNHGHFGIFHGRFPSIDFFTLFHAMSK
jgi:hypothetical protein